MYKYQHGGDIYSQKLAATGKPFVDFSANINPLGLPKGVKKAIVKSLKDCINYPDAFCRELAEATGEFLQVNKDYLFFGNGAADVLFRLALALKPRKALLLAPTFADYEKALLSVDCKVSYYKLPPEFCFTVQENILKSIKSTTDMVVICNPNNPTGVICEEELLEKILKRCQEVGATLLIDECFMDFVAADKAYSFRNKLEQYANLVILKAFTKTFAMPGVRLGYCMTSNEELLAKLHEVGQDWNVSIMAQEAGKAAVKEQKYLAKAYAYVQKQRLFMLEKLRELPKLTVYNSLANYIFFHAAEPSDLVEQLKERGFLIRSCANYHNLGKGYYRIAVKTKRENKALIAALKEITNYDKTIMDEE